MTRTAYFHRRPRKTATLLFTLLPWAGILYAQSPPQSRHAQRDGTSSTASSKKLFETTCAGCHGLDGRGSERGPNIATRQEVVRRSDGDLLKTLRNGVIASGMPSFTALGNVKLSAMVTYIRTLQGGGANIAIPGDPLRGQALFFGAARCSDCHMVQGKGGFIGPDLTVYAATPSAWEIKKAIVSPNDSWQRRGGTVKVTLRGGKRLEGVVRNEDNFSLQLQSLDGTFHLIQKSEAREIVRSEQSLMPADYGKTLTPAQLDDLVGYLMSAARTAMVKPPKKQNWNED